MYAVQKTIPLSFKEQLQDQRLPDRVFALILSSMILFGKARRYFLSAEVLHELKPSLDLRCSAQLFKHR